MSLTTRPDLPGADPSDPSGQPTPYAVVEPQRHSAVGPPEEFALVDARPRLVGGVIAIVVALACVIGALSNGLLGGTQTAQLKRFELSRVGDGDLQIEEATRRLEAQGLVVDPAFISNELLQRGTVFGQDPQPGAKVEQGSIIRLQVSDGPAGTLIPGVVGQQSVDAVINLAGVNLGAKVVERADERVRAGEVLSTNPESGARISPGGIVELTVSSGPPPRIVPVIAGRPQEEVLIDIGRAGLAVGKLDRPFRTDVAAGTVISSDPVSGSAVPRDFPVNLVIATDRPPIPVPYLVGLRQASAQSLLKAAGLVAQITLEPVDPNSPNVGAVIGQGVPPQTKVAPGSSVEIRVGDPSLPPATTPANVAPTTVK